MQRLHLLLYQSSTEQNCSTIQDGCLPPGVSHLIPYLQSALPCNINLQERTLLTSGMGRMTARLIIESGGARLRAIMCETMVAGFC